MQEYAYKINGEPVKVRVPHDRDDLEAFKRWFMNANSKGPVALDTETTGLDIYSPGYRLRTVQFGDPFTAWVIHWERGGAFAEYAARALQHGNAFQIHNAPFDWAVLDRHGRVPGFTASVEHLAPRTIDTRLKAGLIDPRQPQEGGRGTALKPLSAYYIDPSAPDTQGDLTAVFRSLKLTKATGWAGIPLDHPTYNLYAGLDVLLTSRLDAKLDTELKRLEVRPRLVQYEHEIARICAVMQRKGMLLDEEYTRELDGALAAEAEEFEAKARRFGVTNVNAPAQLREALKGMGEAWEDGETTGSGALKVDKAVLHRFADLDRNSGEPLGTRTPNPLALAIIRSKRAGKWRSAYTSTFLETMDSDGRVHPFINSMQARTGRMSVTRPALQTLPSGDHKIRRCLLAEPGEVMISTDFAAVELRVLAALADVKQMKRAIAANEDLHSFTARMVFGEAFTPKHRKISKGIAFGKVYGEERGPFSVKPARRWKKCGPPWPRMTGCTRRSGACRIAGSARRMKPEWCTCPLPGAVCRWTGSALMRSLITPASRLRAMCWGRASSTWNRRGFCRTCVFRFMTKYWPVRRLARRRRSGGPSRTP